MVRTRSKRARGGPAALSMCSSAILLAGASCVPAGGASSPEVRIPPSVAASTRLDAQQQAQPVGTDEPNPPARSYVFRGDTSLDRIRSLDCLAEAVYYEARSESADGRKAVAQVVLNRVRHPAWPNSVCGVVYQGPLRPGGGCQFTFTCDGSLARRPLGTEWTKSRRIAAAALAGEVYEPIGLATHYHTHAVLPPWARRLAKVKAIGAHNFYRLPGIWGTPPAFRDAYSGREPLALPTAAYGSAISPAAEQTVREPESKAPPRLVLEPPQVLRDPIPASDVREAYRNSGQWRPDAPAAITGVSRSE